MERSELIPGAYYTYARTEHHCHEGIFLAVKHDDIVAVDTFWDTSGQNGHILRDAEIATAELLLDPADGWHVAEDKDRPLGHLRPCDVVRITSQHGLRKVDWVRDGAQPDGGTILALREDELREAESDLRAAGVRVEEALRVLSEARIKYQSNQGA